LLNAAISRGRRRRMLVLVARGGELELLAPYGVVRQLFEPAMAQADGALRDRLLAGAAIHAESVVDPRAGPVPDALDRSAVLHGLYWLTANLAAYQPVLLVIDDLHWSDAASASWLVYLARRTEGLPVALILAARPGEPGAGDLLLERLRAIDGLVHVELAPLSLDAVETLAHEILGATVERAFGEACHAATGGTPFYVAELLRALRDDGIGGTAADVPAIDGLTPRAVLDATLARLGRLSGEARVVAEAAALLEPSAELRWIAELAELDLDVVAAAADSLIAVGLLGSVAPCRFAHPILRSAVEREIAPARRGQLHLQAARLLTQVAMPVDAVAAHLMRSPPLGEPWIASTLRQAAREAGARGAPAAAVSYLARALAERPPPRERRELLLELGRAEIQVASPRAAEHLREALALAEHPDEIGESALWLGQMLYQAGALDEAFATLSAVIESTDGSDSDALLEVEAYLLSIAGVAGKFEATAGRAASLEDRTPAGSSAATAVHATLAFRDLLSGAPHRRVRERAARALAEVRRGAASSSHLSNRQAPGMCLVWTDDLDGATELFTGLLETAVRTGRRQSFEMFSALRGYAAHRRGDLADAAADLEPVLAVALTRAAPEFTELVASITTVYLLIEDARPDLAEERARSVRVPAGFERGFMAAHLRHATGAAQLALGKFDEAAATLAAAGELCEAAGIRTPAIFPWRSDLARALAGTPRHDEALHLAAFELRLAEECDMDRARGQALRALGLLTGGAAGLRHLAAATQACARSPDRVLHGWASFEYGAALRRAGRRRDARAPLDAAIDLGIRCGARLLTERSQEELTALGARPRSVMLTGVESLTPSERRVCRLAVQGLRNADIAQALFVSLRTVETHLGHAYRKLDITSRAELAQALAAPSP
ncbi:MAG TPA: LuxR C-terminal-related transcriptional regulator, partial [Solirubrobacteraceae bacterium]|nr:LuxR C-terminal-related transcriptional regulator [Solirubrobacteraceae bacterium]